MVTQNNQDQQTAGLNAEGMAAKINSLQSLNSLSNSEIFEMFSALQGSFRYADQFEKLLNHINTPTVKNSLNADTALQDKILNTVNYDVDVKDMDKFGDFYKAYQQADVFSSHAPVKHKFDKKATDFINNYVSSGMDEPTVLLHFEDIANMLEKNKANLGLDPKDLKILENSIQSIKNDVANFVVANDLDNLASISPKDLEKSFDISEKIASEHKAYQGAYASEMKDALTLLDNLKIVDDKSEDKLSEEEFKKELDIITTEQAKQKCMLDPAFALKSISEQKIDFMQAKAQAITEFVKEQAFLKEALKSYKIEDLVKDKNGYSLKTAKNKAEFEKFKKAFEGLYDSKITKNEKIEVSKNYLFAGMLAKHKNNEAVGQYIEKKRGFSKVLDVAKAKTTKFSEKHPNFCKFAKDTSLGILKVGAIAALGAYVAPAAALVASAGLAVYAINKMTKNIKAKYKKGKAEGKYKKRMDYVKKNPFEVGALVLTAVGAVATVGLLSGQTDGTTRTAIMIGAAVAGGTSIVSNKDLSKKEKALAVATTISVLAGGVLVANLFGGSAAKFAEDKLNSHIKNNDSETHTAQTQTPTTNDQGYWHKIKFWDGLFDKKDDVTPPFATESQETVDNSDVVEHKFEVARAEDTMSHSDLDRISIRNADFFGKEDAEYFKTIIEFGKAESLPEGMSPEEYLYKLGQLINLAPGEHKDSIDLMLKDLGCDDIKLTAEQIAKVHNSLNEIDIKGHYLGEHIGETNNPRITGAHFTVNCDNGEVKIDTPHLKGNYQPVVHTQEVIVDKIVEREVIVDKIVEREVVVDKIVEREVFVDKFVEREVVVDNKPQVEPKNEETITVEEKSIKVVNTDNTLQHVQETADKISEKYGVDIPVGRQEVLDAYKAAKSGDYFIMRTIDFGQGERNQDFIKALNSDEVKIDMRGNTLIDSNGQFFEKHSGNPVENPLGIENINTDYLDKNNPASVDWHKEASTTVEKKPLSSNVFRSRFFGRTG